jgi:hypothetical protein
LLWRAQIYPILRHHQAQPSANICSISSTVSPRLLTSACHKTSSASVPFLQTTQLMNNNTRTTTLLPVRQPSHLNSLLGASLVTLSKMISVQPSSLSPEAIDVVITFRSESSPIYVAADVMEWQPQLMTTNGEAYEHVITVPRDQRTLLYKFRIGDSHWIHDTSVSAGTSRFSRMLSPAPSGSLDCYYTPQS